MLFLVQTEGDGVIPYRPRAGRSVRMDGEREVCVGLSGEDLGWRRILDQERIAFRVDDVPAAPIVLLSGEAPGWLENFIEGGGVAVLSGALPGCPLLPAGLRIAVTGFTPPSGHLRCSASSLATAFAGPGDGELRLHEDRVVKYGVDPDRFPVVQTVRHGAGGLIASGMPLTDLLTTPGDRLRRFSRTSAVTERVASVDKADVADTLLHMLRLAFRLAGLPLVTLPRFPRGSASVLILRIDVDGVFGDNVRTLARVAEQRDVAMSFFLNAELIEAHPGTLDCFPPRSEVGQHGARHTLLEGFEDNVANLREAESWMQATVGMRPNSFVGPRGLWNAGLGQALSELGYRYSSDFGLDFDSLPFRADSGVLQVPVHPYSPERATVWADESGVPRPTSREVREHYVSVMADQVRRGRPAHLYGHPEVLGAMAPEVVPALHDFASTHQLPNLTLGEYADFWLSREVATPQVLLAGGQLSITMGDVGLPVQVSGGRGFDVTVNGVRRGRQARSLARYW